MGAKLQRMNQFVRDSAHPSVLPFTRLRGKYCLKFGIVNFPQYQARYIIELADSAIVRVKYLPHLLIHHIVSSFILNLIS